MSWQCQIAIKSLSIHSQFLNLPLQGPITIGRLIYNTDTSTQTIICKSLVYMIPKPSLSGNPRMPENIGKFCETFNNVDESIIFQVFPMSKILSMIRNQPSPIFSFRRLLVSERDWQVHTSVLFDHSLSGAREGIADSRKHSCFGSYTTLNMIPALFTICMKYSKCAIPLRASVSFSGYKRPSITCGYCSDVWWLVTVS